MSLADDEAAHYAPFFAIATLISQCAQSATVPEALKQSITARKHLLTPNGFPRFKNKTVGNLKTGKTPSQLGEHEKTLAGQAAERLDLDATEALVVIRSFAVLQGGKQAWQEHDQQIEPDADWWSSLETFYFDERITAIKLLVTILEGADDATISPALQEYLNTLMEELLPTSITATILQAFLELSRRALPSPAASSSSSSALWAKQYIREQHELLDLAFCYWYKIPATGNDVKLLLSAIDSSEWGAKQACAAYFDGEARTHAKNVAYTLIALSIVVLSLEAISNPNDPFELPLASQKLPPTDSLLHPNQLLQTHQQVVNLATAFPAATAPFAACWAYALSRLTDSISRGEIAQEYSEFINAIQSTREHSQPVWQRLLTHALPFLFPCLSAALPTTSISTASTLGVLTCLRAPFALLPSMIQLSFLPEDQCDAMSDFACALYGHPEAALLRAHYWSEQEAMSSDATLSEGEKELLDLHARRFPFRPAPLLKLLRALAGGSDLSDTEAALGACSYLRSLPYLTSYVVKGSALGGLPYEISAHDQTAYRVVRPTPGFRISHSVYVPQYTVGVLVSSGNGKDGVVQWDTSAAGWNGWLFVSDLLALYAQKPQRAKTARSSIKSADPFVAQLDDSPPVLQFEENEQEDAVANALDLFAREVLVSKLPSKEVDGKAQAIFEVLEKAIFTGSRVVAASALRALTGLLSLQPGIIWSLLRSGKGDLFTVVPISRGLRGGSALLQLDRRIGSYESLIAMLEFVNALTLEMQRSAVIEEHLRVKAEVLHAAYRWIADQVWSADFGSWRYQEARDRWELASQVAQLWSTLAYDSMLGVSGNLGGAADLVLDSLLADMSQAASGLSSVSPLISLISLSYDNLVYAIRNGRDLDSLACEKALQATLQLTLRLLILRKQRQLSPSYLEHALLTHTTTTTASDKPILEPTAAMLACILAHHAVQGQTVVLASQALAALSVTSFDFRATPAGPQSLLSTFNDPDRQFGVLMQLAEDRHLPIDVRIAIWDLMTAFVTSQPSLAVLVISGKVGSDQNKKKKDKTIVTTAVALIKQHRSDPLDPPVLEAAIRFLVAVWQDSFDHADLLSTVRKDEGFWSAVVNLLTSDIELDVSDETTVLEAIGLEARATMAKAYAARLIALDITASQALRIEEPTSLSSIEGTISSVETLGAALSNALVSSIDSVLHQQVFDAVKSTFKTFNIESVRKGKTLSHPALDIIRPLGSEYVFDPFLLFYKLSALTRRSSDVDNAVYSVEQVNANWSLADAQLAVTKAWEQLLQSALMALRVSKPNQTTSRAQTALEVSTAILAATVSETQTGDVLASIHTARIGILVQLLDAASSQESPSRATLAKLLDSFVALLRHDSLNVNDSLERKTATPFHRPILSSLYLVLHLCAKSNTALEPQEAAAQTKSLELIIRSVCQALCILLTRPSADPDFAYENDVGVTVSIFQEILRLPHAPSPSVWLSICTEFGVLRLGLRSIASTPLSALTAPAPQGTVCRHVLSWLLCISRVPPAAERIAVENFMVVLAGSAIVAAASEGRITITSGPQEERSESHRVWCLALALIARLASVLGSSAAFMAEVCGFARLTLPQQRVLYAWDPSSTFPVPVIEELEVTTSLFASIAHRAPDNEACHLLRSEVLVFLNSLTYAIQHPNTAVASMEPTSLSERDWLSTDDSGPETAPDHSKHPVVGAVVQSFLGLICTITDALAVSLDSFQVLQADVAGWPFEKAVFYPTAKVDTHRPASVGSLIDLSGWCLDLVRAHSTKPTPAAPTAAAILPAYNQDLMQTMAHLTLETSLLLAVSQMALVFYQPGQPQNASSTSRMRRDISNELAQDVLSLLTKATSFKRPGKEQNRVLLALQRFIQLRMK